jgi:adenylate kinase
VDFKPPAQPGVCDIDGSELYQREDDTLETVSNRLAVYERETAPVIGYYERSSRLSQVDGEGPPDEIEARLSSAVQALLDG